MTVRTLVTTLVQRTFQVLLRVFVARPMPLSIITSFWIDLSDLQIGEDIYVMSGGCD
jgi:hypothetical protein